MRTRLRLGVLLALAVALSLTMVTAGGHLAGSRHVVREPPVQTDVASLPQLILRHGWQVREAALRLRDDSRETPESLREQLAEALGWPRRAGRSVGQTWTLGNVRQDDLAIELVAIDSEPGSAIPAIVMKTVQGPARRPAVVHLHQYGMDVTLGKSKDFDLLAAFARRGFIVLSADALLFEERRDDPLPERGPDEFQEALPLAALGRPLFGKWLWDDVVLLDYLVQRDDVMVDRVGVVGFSRGGWEALWLAALDDRVRATLAIAGATDHMALLGDGAVAAPNALPAIVGAEALLPRLWGSRVVRIQIGQEDPSLSVAATEALYGRSQRYGRVEVIPGGHDWGDLARVVEWFSTELGGSAPAPKGSQQASPSDWLPLQRRAAPRGVVWRAMVPQAGPHIAWLHACDADILEASPLRVSLGDHPELRVPLTYFETGYLNRCGEHGVWQNVATLRLEAGPFEARVVHQPAAGRPPLLWCLDFRLTPSASAAPPGLLKPSVGAMAPSDVRARFQPAALLEGLVERPVVREATARSWVAAQLRPFVGNASRGVPTLIRSGRTWKVESEPGFYVTAELELDRAGQVAVVIGEGDRAWRMAILAASKGWAVLRLAPHRLMYPDRVRDAVARTALAAGETLAAGTAWDILAVVALARQSFPRIVVMADRASTVPALIAAVHEPRIEQVFVDPEGLESILDRVRNMRMNGWLDVLPGLVGAGDVPALIEQIKPRPVTAVSP